MAGLPPTTNSQLNISPPPPPLSSPGNMPQTPRSSSIADDSDAEFEPTPIHSPGGPQYDDLPPSYDEAQQQAVADVRNGITPLDPNQIEAHRLTLNEGPDQPEIWEYRVRGEQIEPEHENEQAPDYDSHVNNLGSTVPIQHVENSSSIPVGQVNSRNVPSSPGPDPVAVLLERALEFTRYAPDSDVQYAPRLTRVVAIPQQGLGGGRKSCEKQSKSSRRHSREQSTTDVCGESTQFLRAYAKALHSHSIRPAEFTEFLDGLNALCRTLNLSSEDLVNDSTGPVHDYIRGANEAFFAPRGLRVSLRSLPALLTALNIPSERGQRAGATASVLDPESTAARRALALYPWVEALETNVPEPSTRTLMLREMGARFEAQNDGQDGQTFNQNGSSEKVRSVPVEDDPPHSIPDPAGESPQGFGPWGTHRGFGGRGGRRGAPWSPFGAPGHGPFDAPGNTPFGAPGHGPFGGRGRGPFRGRGRGLFAPRGSSYCGRGPSSPRSHGPDSPQCQNDWAAFGESVGKWSEELGKMVGDLGQQFGKGVAVWGEDVGKKAGTWGENVGRRAGTFGENVAARASGSGTQNQNRNQPTPTPAQPHGDAPPSYEGPQGQETGILPSDTKIAPLTTEAPAYTSRQGHPDDDDDDDASSICSSNSDSDSDSDSDSSEDYPDASALFLARIHSINAAADVAAKKGKKPASEIASERALAIEKAQNDKTALEVKIEETQMKRAIRASLRLKGRELKKEYRRRKREVKGSYKGAGKGEGKGKGKGRAKKSREWKEVRREYREQKRELRREKIAARREWREARAERRRLNKEGPRGLQEGREEGIEGMVWVVVENLVA